MLWPPWSTTVQPEALGRLLNLPVDHPSPCLVNQKAGLQASAAALPQGCHEATARPAIIKFARLAISSEAIEDVRDECTKFLS